MMLWKKLKKNRMPLLLLRNTVCIVIPAVIVFVVLLVFTIQHPVVYRMICHNAESLEDIRQWNERDCRNIAYTVPSMKYIGYDYYEDDKRVGAYYYSFIDGECVLFLMRTKEPEPELKDVRVCGMVLEDASTVEDVKSELAKGLNMDYDSLNALIYPLVISEPDYPYLETGLLFMGIIVPCIVSAWIIINSVFWTIQPYRHPSAKALSEFGDRKLVYEEVGSQLKHRLLQHNYNYYLTDEYLVISNWFTTDFIRIDYIRYISKHMIQSKSGKKQVYRLTMSNPEKMFYEKDFRSEACADEIMLALVRLNPDIDNRTMTVFNLIPEEEAAAEKPKAEDPKVEEPKAEDPKVEEPKAEETEEEESKTEKGL